MSHWLSCAQWEENTFESLPTSLLLGSAASGWNGRNWVYSVEKLGCRDDIAAVSIADEWPRRPVQAGAKAGIGCNLASFLRF